MFNNARGWMTTVLSIFGLCALVFSASSASAESDQQENELTPACRAAETYLGYLGALKYAAIGKLFAENANYIGPDGVTLHHPDEIVAGYAKSLASTRSHPQQFRLANLAPISHNGCLMEFDILDRHTNIYVPVAVDHFAVNEEGKVVEFMPYFQSAQIWRVREILSKVPSR